MHKNDDSNGRGKRDTHNRKNAFQLHSRSCLSAQSLQLPQTAILTAQEPSPVTTTVP